MPPTIIDPKDVDPDKIKLPGQEEQESRDYTLKCIKPTNDPDDPETPQYQQAIDLTKKQTDRLLEAAIREFKAIKQEREELHLEEKWMMLQNQYDGIMEQNQDQQFSLHMHTTKIKIDAIVRAAKSSFLDSDPKFAITPQPGYAMKNSREADEICQQQQDFLDFEITQELNLEGPFEMALYSAAIKSVGILKLPWKYRCEKRQREECYEGKFVIQGIVNGRAVVKNPGLELFVQNYPDAKTRYPGLYDKVKRGKTIYVQADFNDVVYNNPDPQYVENENFYVYDFVDGLKGLKTARCICERQMYTWSELRDMEKSEGWTNIDSMRFPGSVRSSEYKGMTEAQRKESDKEFKDADTRKYPVIEQTYFFNLEDTGDIEDEIKIKFWWSEDREVLLHCQHYPYENISTEYIAIYMRRIRPGFWQNAMSIASDLSDSNLAENALVNFMLEMAWIETTVTPVIKEGSPTEKQLMTRRWNHGVPIVLKKDASEVSKEITFLAKPQSQAAQMIPIIQYLLKQDDDVTGVSSLMTGRESPTDPRAPAIKTMALLKQSGLNIESFVKTALPSFNEIAVVLLALYYQMTEDSKAFLTRKTVQDLTNSDPFKRITRQQMVAKTNIKSQAYAFALDKIQEKQENIALYSVLRSEIAARGDAESLDNLVRALLESWSPQWKTRSALVWPSLSEFKKRQLHMAAQGVAAYMAQLKQQETVTGVPAQADAQKLVAMMSQLQQLSMASPEDQQKAAQQAQKGGGS
jgi:hypothetical protein